jgi:hypothetical protein
MFHLELFQSSIATGANTFAQVTYNTTDNVLPKLNNGIQVSPALPYLLAVAGVGAHMVHVRAQAPSMLPYPYPALSPNNRGSAFESPPRIWDFSQAPIPLRPTEELDIYATQNSGSSETEYVGVIFSDGTLTPLPTAVNPPGIITNPYGPGRFFSVHWTASTTLTAGAWTQVQPTFDQALPAGYYGMIGARTYSATALFFRMFPAMAPLWRPGGVAVQAYDQLDPVNQRGFQQGYPTKMGWGMWLSFYQNVPPQVEIWATSADTAEEGWMDLVYLGTQTTSS